MSLPPRLRAVLKAPATSKVLLVICAVIWGSSFLMMKDAAEAIPVFWLLAIRFSMAAVLMLALFWRQFRDNLDRSTVGAGILIGLFMWSAYATQTIGLTMTTPGKNAFITGSYCVMVPFVAWAWGMGRPRRYDLVAAVVCLAGLGLVALDNGFPLNPGDALTLLCALLFALQLVAVSRYGAKLDVWSLTIWQFLVMTVCSIAVAFFEPAPPAEVWTPGLWGALVYFGVVCSFVALAVMNYAFTRVPPAEGSLLASLESPSGVLFSVLAGYEVLTGRLLLGFGLIFLAVLISNGWPWLKERLQARREEATEGRA